MHETLEQASGLATTTHHDHRPCDRLPQRALYFFDAKICHFCIIFACQIFTKIYIVYRVQIYMKDSEILKITAGQKMLPLHDIK